MARGIIVYIYILFGKKRPKAFSTYEQIQIISDKQRRESKLMQNCQVQYIEYPTSPKQCCYFPWKSKRS